MNDKTKECILNTIIAVGIVSIVIVFPGSILCAVFPDAMGVIVQVAFVIASIRTLTNNTSPDIWRHKVQAGKSRGICEPTSFV